MSRFRPVSDSPLDPWMRTIRKWILVCDGDETVFDRKKHALLCAPVCRMRYHEVKLLEQTTLRYRGGMIRCPHPDQTYRIDISNQIPE